MALRDHDVAFVLVPGFSMIGLFSALEPLRVANSFAGDVFSWRFVSENGEAAVASNGIPVSVTHTTDGIGLPDMIVICASYGHEEGMTPRMINCVRKLARTNAMLCGVDTGAFALAEAGVLDGYKATCHWQTLPAFRERYLAVDVVETPYAIDRGRMTSSGGTTALDMMLDWLKEMEGNALSIQVADALVHTRQSGNPGQARIAVSQRYPTDDHRVLSAISAMEAHVEEVMPVEDIATAVGISLRQLERLFSQQLGAGPKAVYQQLRLEHAEHLLTYSAMSVREVGLAAGFASLEQFSRSYKSRYGQPPSVHRRGRQ